MDLRSIYVSNGTGIFLMLMLQYMSRATLRRRRLEDKIYAFLLIGVTVGCFMEGASYALDGRLFPGARFLNYAANTYLYTVNLMLPFSVMIYVDLGLYGDTRRIWRCYRPQIIVGIAMLSLTFLNLFVPVCFYIDEANVYARRPLSYFYFVVIAYYCVTAMIMTRSYEKKYGARTFLSVNAFMIPILVGTALQFMFYGLSLGWLASAIGLNGLYMMQQNEAAYIDPLVETYNRHYMNHILSAWNSRGLSFVGVMVDIDRFKSVNDKYGHSEGDNALKVVAGILKAARRDHEWVFRFAGDEFIVLKLATGEDSLAPYLDEVNRRLEAYNRGNPPYPLALSYGISRFDSGDVDAFMKEMDERMYAMKQEHHQK